MVQATEADIRRLHSLQRQVEIAELKAQIKSRQMEWDATAQPRYEESTEYVRGHDDSA